MLPQDSFNLVQGGLVYTGQTLLAAPYSSPFRSVPPVDPGLPWWEQSISLGAPRLPNQVRTYGHTPRGECELEGGPAAIAHVLDPPRPGFGSKAVVQQFFSGVLRLVMVGLNAECLCGSMRSIERSVSAVMVMSAGAVRSVRLMVSTKGGTSGSSGTVRLYVLTRAMASAGVLT